MKINRNRFSDKKWQIVILLALISPVPVILWQRTEATHKPEAATFTVAPTRHTGEPIEPLPALPALDARKVALGEKLFHDPRLSRDNTISCASCHALDTGGTDRRARSIGIGDKVGPINSPTVFNSGLNFKQFWDGRAESLEAQVDGPTHAPDEMGSNWDEILGKLGQSPEYVTAFKDSYPDGLRASNVRDAIATFERSLITPDSRLDRFLRGEDGALNEDEKEGYRLFKAYGCASCHQGINVGGNMFQEFGVMGDYFADRGNVTKADYGRFNVTGDEADRYIFKVPSLRNVALTAPYFHDGSAQSLEEAVAVMSRYQLGRRLPPADVERIVLFLRALSGEYKGRAL